MSRMKTETKSGLTKVATGAVAAVGAVAAMGGGPAATALAAALPSIGEAFLGVFSRRAKKLTELFAEELLSDGGFQAFVDAPSETAHLLLETNPQQAELIARVVRELVNAPSEKAARPLAFLVREYDRAGRTEVDEYFRGAAALFASLDGQQLERLRVLLRLASESADEMAELQQRGGMVELVNEETAARHQTFEEAASKPSEAAAAWRRLFNRLKTENLATDNPGGFVDTRTGPDVLRIDRTTASRLLALLR